MDNKNIYEKIFEKPCEICKKTISVDIYNQGKCPFCGWWNCFLNEENPESVAMPNVISLNRAKQYYSEDKPFEPDLNDFLDALHCYGEMQFEFKDIYYAVEIVDYNQEEVKLSLYNSQTKEIQYFNDDEDFINNAKVEDKLLKDIWEETTDRYWLQ